MKKNIMREADAYAARRHRSRIWKRVVGALACVVVFCTAYALILPAVTMEKDVCSLPEHTHTEACYTKVTPEAVREPVCSLENLNLHEHTAGCLDKNGEPVCGYSDFVVHKHDASCYDGAGNLWCPLEEIEPHTHDRSCYATERGRLICGKEESEGHTHSAEAGCYDAAGELVCQIKESSGHQHTDKCYEQTEVLICEKEEIILHTHNEDCFDKDDNGNETLICDKQEVQEHVHSDSCFQTVDADDELTCTKEVGEGAHQHDESCYNEDGELICGLEESEGHQHSALCYGTWKLTCDLEEHTHTEACGVDNGIMLASDGISDEVREALAKLGIYPGEKTEDDTWVAYNAATEDKATVKAEVVLPKGTKVPENYYLFVRLIDPHETGVDDDSVYPNYPDPDVVDATVGEANDFKVYAIHWVEISDEYDNGYNYNTESVLTDNAEAKITLEYVGKDGALLSGHAAERKLMIFNGSKGGQSLTEVGSVTDVSATENAYTGFTFTTTKAGPYVFVSKKVANAYVKQLTIKENGITDGSAPWDKNNDPGNDSDAHNNIVRSYDTIKYNLAVQFSARHAEATSKEVNMHFEMSIYKGITAARFDTSQMAWLGSNYNIEYYDNTGNLVVILASDGKFYVPAKGSDGNILYGEDGLVQKGSQVRLNALLEGSDKEENSYTLLEGYNITEQRLTGWTKLTDDSNALTATKSLTAAILVRNADNGEIFTPTFKVWVDGNDDNYGSESAEGAAIIQPAEKVTDNVIVTGDEKHNGKYTVKVSAGAKFNLQLKRNTDMSYKSWFDFSTGKEVDTATQKKLEALAALKENWTQSNPAEFTDKNNECGILGNSKTYGDVNSNAVNYRYGRLSGYGITLQLYNEIVDSTSKGFKGLSLPVGDIEFDLNLASLATNNGSAATGAADEYTAILWDYNENTCAEKSESIYPKDSGDPNIPKGAKTDGSGNGNGGRNLYWDGQYRSSHAKGAAPWNYSGTTTSNQKGCYYGGEWSMTTNGTTSTDAATPATVTGTGGDTIYHFKVSSYDFDFDNQWFPLEDASSDGTRPGYDSYKWGFSAGYIQVLSVMPRYITDTAVDLRLDLTVGNLSLETRAQQRLTPTTDGSNKITYSNEGNTDDNKLQSKLDLYTTGGPVKGNAFSEYKTKNGSMSVSIIADNYLGTNYWGVSYDCCAFAGQTIVLKGFGRLNSGSDYRIKAMNLLQLFDSRALTIVGQPGIHQQLTTSGVGSDVDKAGTATYLYAADPDYKNGYDTNENGVLTYMNKVQEEDLIYYTSLEALQKDGYTCIGVLLELRNCSIRGGNYQTMNIPVKVNGDDPNLVNQTIATVNSARFWTDADTAMQTLSWANGEWDAEKGVNVLAGYVTNSNAVGAGGTYNPFINNLKNIYQKVKYQDSKWVSGHENGVNYGNSLLILSYKAHIGIGIDGKDSNSGSITYNLNNGEGEVIYRLKNIKTEVEKEIGAGEDRPTTNLTIKTVLDEDHEDAVKNGTHNEGVQCLTISSGSYQMEGYLVTDGVAASEKTAITISDNKDAPTVLEYDGNDGKRHRISIYAQRSAAEITFEISAAPIGIALPDIVFSANFAQSTLLENNATFTTRTYISGSGDCRAYDETHGNTDGITVQVGITGGTAMNKMVSDNYIELDKNFTYTVSYTNGDESHPVAYFYDLLPVNGDTHGSVFKGKANYESLNWTLTDANGKEIDPDGTQVTMYYSTDNYKELSKKLNTDCFGKNSAAVEGLLESQDGADHSKPFKLLSGLQDGDEENVTGVFLKVTNLPAKSIFTFKLAVDTADSKAGGVYKNVAYAWATGTNVGTQTSPRVETNVISRKISGVVWWDKDLNGIRDPDEELLKGVTATLFKKQDNGKYMSENIKDVTGADISTFTTNDKGEYFFDKLPEGDYIVAFSGGDLSKYTGATVYQPDRGSDVSNDGKAISELEGVTGIDPKQYAYFIRYSSGKSDPAITLHSLKEIAAGVTLNGGVEDIDHQDLGVVIAGHELPMTGGSGTIPYTVTGLTVVIGAGLLLVVKYKKRRKADSPSA